jgi:hypothetical protein
MQSKKTTSGEGALKEIYKRDESFVENWDRLTA